MFIWRNNNYMQKSIFSRKQLGIQEKDVENNTCIFIRSEAFFHIINIF